MKRLYALILLLFSLILPFDGQDGSFLRAQGNDPVLAGMIFQYTDKAKKELKQQEQMMQLVSTGHIWIKEEVEGTTNCRRSSITILTGSTASSAMQLRSMVSIMR